MSVARGEIALERASRSFSVRADRGRTLKELLLGRAGAGGPPPVRALHDVSLCLRPGETVGMVGRNGAGKSSTLRVLAGIVPLDSGRVESGGRVVSLLELGAGFGRDFSGRENIYLNGALHGLGKRDVEERLDSIIAFSELGEFIDVPVKAYSSGMFVRLGFAIAVHLDADVLLIDEVLAVGDEAFQRKCLRRISEQIARGTTLMLVSHDPGAIERVCARVVVLEEGRIVFDGPVAEGLLFYHRLIGTDVPEEPRKHRGDKPVAVVGLELQDGQGRRCRIFRSGEPLRVELGLSAPGPVTLEVRDEHGRAVFATRTEAAADRLAFEIPRLALLGGDYDFAVGAGDGFDRLAGFSVAHEQGVEGVADLRGEWSVPGTERIAS